MPLINEDLSVGENLRLHGVSRRAFIKFCTATASAMALPSWMGTAMAEQLRHAPRPSVVYLSFQECTGCFESLTRSFAPTIESLIFNVISLDYDDTLMAAAGADAEKALTEIPAKYPGEYVLAVEGNPPLNEDGMYCIVGGRPFVEKLQEVAANAKAVIAWGACASWGCVQAARPNPTHAVPIDKVITDKPIIKVPGCPPIAEVMTGVISYILTFNELPELDNRGRPAMFYGQRIHDKCYRRPHFDAGEFVETWDDEGARKGYCLYKMGCKGPTTYNACSTIRWNGGVSFPIQSGHGCIGCSEENFWDNGPFYSRLANVGAAFGVEATADEIGETVAAVALAGVAVHAGASIVKHFVNKKPGEGEK